MNSVARWIEGIEQAEERVGILGLWKTGVSGVEWLKAINAAGAERRIAEAQSIPMRGPR